MRTQDRQTIARASLLACAFALASAFAASAPLGDAAWTVLTPARVSTLSGATITVEPDGSLLVQGPSTPTDTYTLEFEAPPKGITAFRIEALPDPGLPALGPGRSTNGNFVLTDLRVGVGPKGSRKPRPIPLQNATASFAQDGLPAAAAIDGVATTGWAIHPKVGVEQRLVVETRADLDVQSGSVLVIELEFGTNSQNTLGHFRVSATSNARPVRIEAPKDEGNWGELQEQINRAIDRGCEYLLTQQLLDGSWDVDQNGYRNGGTSLVLYALLKSGVKKDHPAVVRALEWLKTGNPRETYTLGCELLALASFNDPAVEPWMKELGEVLLHCQQPNGGFNYGTQGATDLSNSQYGALGLRAAALHGFKVPTEVWEKLAQYVLSQTDEGGGGAYAPLGFKYHADSVATGSMTAAGAGILAICDEQLRGRSKTGNLLGMARRGGEWIGQNFVVNANPRGDGQWNYYWLYGVERVGALLKQEELGGHRWYREGAKWLVEKQDADGKWSAGGNGPICSTSWTLLFLTRATAVASGRSNRSLEAKNWGGDDPRKALSIRASGDTPMTFWISSWGEAEVANYEWPKEAGRGVHVKQVEWFARGATDNAPASIARLEKDPSQPCGRERFGAQFSFPLPGHYSLSARATIVTPPAADGSAGGSVDVDSEPLEVVVAEVTDATLLDYARDPARNLLTTQKVVANGSSTLNDWWEPRRATDGLLSRGWASKDDDWKPKLSLELEKPVRANVLQLTPAVISPDRPARIVKVAVTLNGKGPPIEVVVTREPNRKTRLKLPMPIIVRRIDLEVTEVTSTDSQLKSVGLAEVELQMESGAKK